MLSSTPAYRIQSAFEINIPAQIKRLHTQDAGSGGLRDQHSLYLLEVNTMRPNNLKMRLKEGKLLIGCLLAYNAPWLVEVLGTVGYDFVAIDLEHEPMGNESVANLIRAADGVNLPSLVRMPCTEQLLPFLDAGVHGVIVPDIRDRQHAEKVVEMTRFYPIGGRTYYT